MITLRQLLFGIGMLGLLIVPVVGWTQADPAWLRAWHEVQQRRPSVITSQARIAPEKEPGVPFVIRGVVVTPDGLPASDVIVHAYHRDHEGFELGHNDRALTTWELNGWVRTDADGRFQFDTIRPATDHLGREAAHIHFTLLSEDYGRQWATKIFLADDALITKDDRRRSQEAEDFGGVREIELVNEVQSIDVKFRLKEEGDF